MPFEPLGTDEPLTAENAPSPSDFETTLTKGCLAALLGSLLIFGLVLWPFLVIPEHTAAGLGQILLLGALPAAIVGAIMVRIFEMPGVSGFGGGALCGAVFMWLRLRQTALRHEDPSLSPPDYPALMASVVVPLGWVVLAAIVVAITYPREKL